MHPSPLERLTDAKILAPKLNSYKDILTAHYYGASNFLCVHSAMISETYTVPTSICFGFSL